MKPRKLLALLFLLIAFGLGAFAIYKATAPQQSGVVTVSASFYPLYDFTKAVGGSHVSVANITPAGAEPHSYEPSPKTLAQAQKSNLFIYNGSNFEPWADKFSSNSTQASLKMSDKVALQESAEHSEDHADAHEDSDTHGHEGYDPHYWLDPVIAQTMVAAIRDSLIVVDPDHTEAYNQNAKAYISQLKALDADYKRQLSRCSINTIVTSHDAAGYLAERYGFTVTSIAGLSPDEEPSAAKMAEVSDIVRQKGIKFILFETLVSTRLADTIAQETGAKTAVFDPLEGLTNEDQQQGKSYLSVQRDNLAALRAALACQ